jgi:ABC-type lipoprotein release transport system permease subunit
MQNSFETLLRQATVKAVDGVAKKATDIESIAEKKIGKLLTKWNEMDKEQKEHVAGIAVATITTAVAAIIAARRAAKSPIKTAAKSLAKRALKKK